MKDPNTQPHSGPTTSVSANSRNGASGSNGTDKLQGGGKERLSTGYPDVASTNKTAAGSSSTLPASQELRGYVHDEAGKSYPMHNASANRSKSIGAPSTPDGPNGPAVPSSSSRRGTPAD